VNLLVHKDLGLSEQLGCEDCDGGSSITDFVILDFGDVDKNLSETLLELCLFFSLCPDIRTLAAALSSAMDFKMVAPSLVTKISPVDLLETADVSAGIYELR
jgi:hypothetical protein